MSTIETAFRGRVPLVNLDKGSAIPLRFVFELPHNDHALESQIKPHLLIDNRQMLDIFLYQDGDEVAVSTIFGDGYGRGFAPLGQRTRPMNIKRSVHSGESQVFPIPLEGSSYVSSRLLSMLLMRRGILSTSLKEVTKGAIQMTKGLLQG